MKYVALGRVHPERACVHIPTQTWENETGKVSFTCGASQIHITLEDPRVSNYLSAHGTAEHIAKTFISALGFLLGCSYTVEISQVIEADEPFVIGVQQEHLIFTSSGDQIAALFDELTPLIRHDLFLRFAIQDYTAAIADKLGCALFCYRAIESLSKSIGLTNNDRKNWAALHSALGTTPEPIYTLIKDFADPVRHGGWTTMKQPTEQDRLEMLKLTKDFLTRYIHFKQTGQSIVL